jgi:hypothetical protein
MARIEAGGARPRSGSRVAYSPYLLSGLLRCALCGARMIAQRTTRRKGGHAYVYGYYRCSFAAHKGPAVCPHGTWYRQEPLEGLLLARFQAATTPVMLDALADAVNRQLDAAVQARGTEVDRVKGEILRLERAAGHLVRFLAGGGESPTVREELQAVEAALRGLRLELASLQPREDFLPPRASRAWVAARVANLAALLRRDPVRARMEIQKHLDGDLELRPLPDESGRRRVELRGRLKHAGLLIAQEAGSPTIGCGGWI